MPLTLKIVTPQFPHAPGTMLSSVVVKNEEDVPEACDVMEELKKPRNRLCSV